MTPPRWEPDGQLVAAVLSTPKAARKMADLPDPDRVWVVAGLTLAGMTAKDIAARLGCSLRLVRSIRALEMTQVCVWAQAQLRAADAERRAERCEKQVAQLQLASTRVELARVRSHMAELFDKFVEGDRVETFRTCGHPKLNWNVYRHKGREYCRECNRDRAGQYRERRKTRDHTNRVTILQADSVASVS